MKVLFILCGAVLSFKDLQHYLDFCSASAFLAPTLFQIEAQYLSISLLRCEKIMDDLFRKSESDVTCGQTQMLWGKCSSIYEEYCASVKRWLVNACERGTFSEQISKLLSVLAHYNNRHLRSVCGVF